MTNRNGRALAALMMSAVLAGCGGGGSDGDGDDTMNHAPGADAGADITRIEGASFTLVGTGADTDGDTLTYEWTVPEGFTTGARTAATLNVNGTPDIDADKRYTFAFKVTDSHGESATDNVTVKLTAIAPETVSLDFDAVESAAPGLAYISGSETVSGLDAATAISISGANCEYSINDGAFTAAAGTIANNQAVRVKGKAADAFETAGSCTLTVGDVTADFAITTGANAFDFAVEPGRLVFSWHAFSGITRYELTRHNSATDETAFVDDDIAGDAASHEQRISVHLTDWVNDRFMLSACNDTGCVTLPGHEAELVQALSVPAINYLKASNTTVWFGASVALDGDTLAVGAPYDGDSGAVYVFEKNNFGEWSQRAYIKASNPDAGDEFGSDVALDGDVLVVGATSEDSAGAANDNSASQAGAAYVFERNASGDWLQQAYLKASNAASGDYFGGDVSISGGVIVIGARGEDGNGSDGEDDDSASDSGAAYVFERDVNGAWVQTAYLKASNAGQHDNFGSVAVSGNTIAVGALGEDGNGVDGEMDNSIAGPGAAYIFQRDENGGWQQQAYLKASNLGQLDGFGNAVAISGTTVVVGASGEDSSATGADGDQDNNDAPYSGAVYVFESDEAGNWVQQAYLKASNTDAGSRFGYSVALSDDTIVVGAINERRAGTGVNSGSDVITTSAGAAYVFLRNENGGWMPNAYLKASNTENPDQFGISVAVSGNTIAIGANQEASNSTGINGNQDNNDAINSGSVYVY